MGRKIFIEPEEEIREAEQKEEAMRDELAGLDLMTDEEACDYYNCDSKEEARRYIQEWWQHIA